MKVSMLMIRKRAKADFSGLTEGNTREDGETASNTESEPTLQQAVKPSRVSGKKEKDCIGFPQTINDFIFFVL